jgi:hypothetical protein
LFTLGCGVSLAKLWRSIERLAGPEQIVRMVVPIVFEQRFERHAEILSSSSHVRPPRGDKRFMVASMKWAEHPNLRKRPRAPSKGRGPVQRAIRRAFAVSGTEALTSSAIYDWAHIRRRRGRRKSMPFGIYSRTLRTLRTMCEPVERVPPHGAWLWRLRPKKNLAVDN